MSSMPVLGVALSYKHVETLKDWIFEKNRALELQDFFSVKCHEDDQSDLIEAYGKLLDGFEGKLGIHGPFYGLNLINPDPAFRRLTQKRLLDALEKCEKLGATHMVVHSPFTFWHSLNIAVTRTFYEQIMDAAQATLEPVVERAEQIDCCLMLENIEDSDPALRSELVAALDSPMLKVSIDTGHAQLAHNQFKAPSVAEFFIEADALLGHVHLQDSDGYADRHWHPGEGCLPWGGIFKTIADLEISPRLIVEIFDRHEMLPKTVQRLEDLGLAC